MKFLIKIDRDTIKKNPNAGNTVYFRNIGPPEYYRSIVTKEGDLWVRRDYISNDGKQYLLEQEMSMKTKDNQFGFDIQQRSHQPYERIRSISPEPEYLFKYENTIVQCDECESEFSHRELISDEIDDFYCDTVCPKCNKWNCCEIEFEKLSARSLCH